MQPDSKRLVTESTVKKNGIGTWSETALAGVVDAAGRAWVRYMPDGTVDLSKLAVTKLATILGAKATTTTPAWSGSQYLAALADSAGRTFAALLPDGTVEMSKATFTKAFTAMGTKALTVTPSWASPAYLAALADSTGRAAVLLLPDGTVETFKVTIRNLLNLPGGGLVKTVAGSIFSEAWTIADTNGRAWLVGKADGKTFISLSADSRIPDSLLSNSEVAAARGSRAVLSDRVNSGLGSYGFTKDYINFPQYTRWTRMLTRRLIYGDASTQLDIAIIGDSYSQNASRWSGVFWSALKNLYGDAGVGWVGFSNPSNVSLQNGSVRTDTSLLLTGTWTPNYYGTHSPDLGEVASSTPGDTVVVTFPVGQNSAKLFFVGGATGSAITYAWNGNGTGATALSLVAGATLQTADLAGIGSTSTTLTLTVTGGTTTLCGVDIRKTANGIRVHKIAATGSRAQQWAAVNSASWGAGVTALAPRAVIVMLGVNDQGSARTPAQVAADVTTIFTNVDAAIGHTAYDAVIVAAEENQRGLSPTLASYSDVFKGVAETIHAAFVELQPLFGEAPGDYAFGSARPWHVADNVHPDPVTGGRVIADAMVRLFTGR